MIAEKKTFNLVDDPWIPIAGVGDRSLRDLFEHPEYQRLGGTPVEKIVILRLLLCIVHASTPIPDEGAWAELTLEQISQNSLAYLEKWHDRFDLYDEEHPFLQFPQLKGKSDSELKDYWNMTISASGNASRFRQEEFVHSFSMAEKARLLLCGTCYACRKKKTKVLLPYALLGEKRGYLHSFLLGKTILETIKLNLLTNEDILKTCLYGAEPIGKPFWEKPFVIEDKSSCERYMDTYMGTLFPINKFLCIEGDRIYVTEGIAYKTLEEGFWDPGITIYRNAKNVRQSLCCQVKEKPWRQIKAIIEYLRSSSDAPSSSNAFIRCGRNNYEGDWEKICLWTGGVSVNVDTVKTQKISGRNDYVESEFLIPMRWYDGEDCVSFERYKNLMRMLDDYAASLYSAVNRYFKMLDEQRSGDLASQAVQLFWEKMEPEAQAIIKLSLEEDESEKVLAAKKAWQGVARSCYDQFCPHLTPRQIQAYVQCTPYFRDKSDKAKPTKKVKKEKV
ncbi:MAG: type I-E CRISPR-associated protein Cse1/CasA [Planctomycetia bacterium]|nr:type I-E CRISPR-associated protein Cse1/CasA [Planctomycetia bacterium]